MKKVITCKGDGIKIVRLSRWIKLHTVWNVTRKHSLYEYCRDEYGRHPYEKNFDDTNGTSLDYFQFKGCKYALDNFIRCGSSWVPMIWQWEDENGKLQFISGVQQDNYFNPLLIEIDEGGEYVRVYEEVK